jgi:hypothetical protein
MRTLVEIRKAFGVNAVTIQNLEGQRIRVTSVTVNWTGGAGITTEQVGLQCTTPGGTLWGVFLPAPNAAGTAFVAIGAESNLAIVSTVVATGVAVYPTASRVTGALPSVATIESSVLVSTVTTGTATYNNLQVTYELELYE